MGVQYWRWTHLWQESQQPHFVNTSETALRSSDGVKLLQTQHFSLSGTDSSLLEQSSITLTWLTFEILERPDVPCVGLLGLDFFLDWDLTDLNRFKPSSKMFYWPFQGGTSFVDLLCFCSVLCLLCFVRVCLYVLRGHLLGKGWPLGSRLWCLLWVCHFPIGILGQVWYLIVSIPDLCNLTYFNFWRSRFSS